MNISRVFRTVLAFLGTAAALCGLVFGAGAASAAPQQGNPNPIDWTVITTIIGRGGEDLPFRNGQHDYGTRPGFGLFHIQDKHSGFDPDPGLLQQAADTCKSNPNPNDKTVCEIKDSEGKSFVAVWTERIDPAAPDHRPIGIITAYYK